MNMLNRTLRHLSIAAGAVLVLLSLTQVSMASVSVGNAPSASTQQSNSLADKVQHSILMLPYYGVFDAISYSVQGDTVTLAGDVRRALLKSEAADAVRQIDGVKNVINDIKILPVSPMDDSLRLRLYRAIYRQPGFERYGIQATKPIRIIVNNGNVTLLGVVGSRLDKTLAGNAAMNVPFAFSVTNDLRVS